MGKQSGLGARFFVAGVDLSGDVGSLSNISTPRAVKDVTGIDKEAFERIYLTRDGAIAYAAHWNPAGAHVTLSALPTTDQPVMYVHRPAIGQPAATMVGKQINYDGTRAADGGLDFAVQAMANGFGLEWGLMLTDGIAETASAGAQDGLDSGAATTNFGLQAYLHVFAFTGTSATVAIQDSDNDGSPDTYANVTDGVFAAATAVGSQRIQTDRDQAVKRWLRVNVAGTFTEFDFAVAVVRNQAEVLF